MSPGAVEAEAAVFIGSAIVVSYALDMGAYMQASAAAAIFILWNAWVHRNEGRKPKRRG